MIWNVAKNNDTERAINWDDYTHSVNVFNEVTEIVYLQIVKNDIMLAIFYNSLKMSYQTTEKVIGKPYCILLNYKKRMLKGCILHDPSNMAFWKRQSTKMAKRSVVTRGLREGRRVKWFNGWT